MLKKWKISKNEVRNSKTEKKLCQKKNKNIKKIKKSQKLEKIAELLYSINDIEKRKTKVKISKNRKKKP